MASHHFRYSRPSRGLALAVGLVLAGLLVVAAFPVVSALSHRDPPARSYAGGRWDGPSFGGTWVLTSLTVQTNALLVDPEHPNVIWAGTADGAWISPDGGASWRRGAGGLTGHGVLSLGSATGIHRIVAGDDNGGIYLGRQQAGGKTWRLINHPLGANWPIFCVAASGNGGHTILAGTTGGIYRGTQTAGGWDWRRVARTGDSSVTSVVWAPWNPQLAFASVFGAKPAVLVTHDGGLTWRPDVRGLPGELPSQTLVPLPSRPPRVIFTTMGGGVWLQSPGGRWRDISNGLPARHGMPVAVVWKGKTPVFYTGTMGFGVYGKEGKGPWQRLGTGLQRADHTILGLVSTSGPSAHLLAATALGVFRYVPPSSK